MARLLFSILLFVTACASAAVSDDWPIPSPYYEWPSDGGLNETLWPSKNSLQLPAYIRMRRDNCEVQIAKWRMVDGLSPGFIRMQFATIAMGKCSASLLVPYFFV